jgi:hypothetical protein
MQAGVRTANEVALAACVFCAPRPDPCSLLCVVVSFAVFLHSRLVVQDNSVTKHLAGQVISLSACTNFNDLCLANRPSRHIPCVVATAGARTSGTTPFARQLEVLGGSLTRDHRDAKLARIEDAILAAPSMRVSKSLTGCGRCHRHLKAADVSVATTQRSFFFQTVL